MSEAIDPLLVVVLLINFFLLGTARLKAVIDGSALQGLVLGLLAFLVHGHGTVWSVLLAVAAAAVKGVAIPALLHQAMRDSRIRREVEPVIGFVPSLLLGALAAGGAIAVASTLPLAPQHRGALTVPAALATVFTGFLLLTTRRKAISQVVGYLILENGVFLMGLTLLEAMPFLVEVGVLLDVFVAILILGIMIHHIQREFSSLDTTSIAAIRD